jgi:hypothetical protein
VKAIVSNEKIASWLWFGQELELQLMNDRQALPLVMEHRKFSKRPSEVLSHFNSNSSFDAN